MPQRGYGIQPRVARSATLGDRPQTIICPEGAADAEEIVQDAIAIAAKLYDNAERAGKAVSPGNITYYALQHAKSGRRSYGQSKTCPLHPSTQLNGKIGRAHV